MTVKTKKWLLAFTSICLITSAVGIVVIGFGPAYGTSTESPTAIADPNLEPIAASTKAKPIKDKDLVRADFETLWERPLRRVLFDPPPPPPKVIEKKALPPLQAKLVATMIESDESTAVLRLGRGEVVFRKVGETLGGDDGDAKVSKIEAGSVLIKRMDEESRLLVEGAKTR